MPAPADLATDKTLDNEQLYRRYLAEKARRLQAEEALREAEEELARLARITSMGEFAASLAHEVSQPLAAIVLQADVGLMSLQSQNTERVRDALQLIRHAGALREYSSNSRYRYRYSTGRRTGWIVASRRNGIRCGEVSGDCLLNCYPCRRRA